LEGGGDGGVFGEGEGEVGDAGFVAEDGEEFEADGHGGASWLGCLLVGV